MRASMFVLSVASCLGLCASVTAQTYKWVDANGRTQYSDKRPEGGVKSEEVRRSVSTVSSGSRSDSGSSANAAQSLAEQDQAFRKRQLDARETAQKQAKADVDLKNKEEQCRRARSLTASLDAGGRQVRFDEKGERYYLDDKQMESERARVRADAASFCK